MLCAGVTEILMTSEFLLYVVTDVEVLIKLLLNAKRRLQ